MTFKLNYEAIYKLRPLQAAIHQADNNVRRAKEAAQNARANFQKSCEEFAGGEQQITVSNVGCVAEGISAHVYARSPDTRIGHAYPVETHWHKC